MRCFRKDRGGCHKNYIYYELNLSVLDEAILWMSELRREDRAEEPQKENKDVLAGGPQTVAAEGE